MHAVPTVFCPFQKYYRKTGRTVQFLLSNGAKWSVKNVLTEINYKRTKNVTSIVVT